MGSIQNIRSAFVTPSPSIGFEYLDRFRWAIQSSLDYLSSPVALQSLDADPYWPKWDSPWWHMSVLYELGIADRIPPSAVRGLVGGIQRQYVPQFFAAEIPAGRDPARDTFCHCSLGNIFQVLSAAGVDADQVIPWAREWFLRYQMPDGGLNCDESAYRAELRESSPSSIVGTIAPLEAVLFFTQRPFKSEESKFLDAGAQFLMERKLRLGCSAPHNQEEKLDEAEWLKPCFPRFYFYDILRGLRWLLQWSATRRKAIPASAIEEVVVTLADKFPDGWVCGERYSFVGEGTRLQISLGVWGRDPRASHFQLLDRVSEIGEVSPILTRHWSEAKALIDDLLCSGLITE